MGLQIHNTLSGRKEPFIPIKAGEVRMYVCGVTVYDSCHVGHARSLLTFDVIYRYLCFLGYQVAFVRNFTDLDDKIIQRAKEQGTTSEAIATRYIREFSQDSAALGLLPPTHEPKATEHIPEIISLIRRLEEKGMAYRIDGDVFFPVERFPGYGKLSRRKIEELEAGARVEVDERKRSPMDFALWKASKEGEPFWESPWGEGRPGWHVECSAMSTKYLGQPFDIHGGGRDLVFPHHENEIAQSEGAFDCPFARYWIHNGFLNINQEKMSKSLGNIYTIREILERYEAATLRYYFLGSHYRSPIDFFDQGLEDAEKSMERIYETMDRLDRLVPANGGTIPDEAVLDEFRREMDEDFNTPRALAFIFDEIHALNRRLDEGKTAGLSARVLAMKSAGEVLGLFQEKAELFLRRKRERWMRNHGLSAQAIEELIQRRDRARSAKQWQEADRIRAELQERGITLEDTPGGTIWKVR
ncbi:MAG TPA: cysteine--tRNA ligase [Deltaproteobacteria bacterium]|nr:MAG: cysteine--tRNA ligase [Deltaproteobacteria bacterium RIFOXYA2_FULL_55_11]HBA39995.1 cysteine--tRNA ligase [Deltaproteobacteria bacterium]